MIKLIKEYKEGLKEFFCSSCGHKFNIAKDNKKNKCPYCGEDKLI